MEGDKQMWQALVYIELRFCVRDGMSMKEPLERLVVDASEPRGELQVDHSIRHEG